MYCPQPWHVYPYLSQFFFLSYFPFSDFHVPNYIDEKLVQQNLRIEQKASEKSGDLQKNNSLDTEQTQSKLQNQKKEQIQDDSDYQVDRNTFPKFYKKKNTESNIANQIYSYISTSKSKKLMMKLWNEDQFMIQEFYKLMRKIRKANKKYVNRKYIQELMNLKQGNSNFKTYQRSKCKLSIQKVRKVLRISIKYFLQHICDCGLLTSKKMNKDTLFEHFLRRREFYDYLVSTNKKSLY